MEVLCLVCFIGSFISRTNTYDYNDTDSHYDKCKQFEKSLGDPNIFFDEEKRLVLKVHVSKGVSNRILDSGVNSVAVRLKYNQNDARSLNKELVKYLSKVLSIQETFFNVTQGNVQFQKLVRISETAAKPYGIIDKLVAALEETARDEPSALTVTDQTAIQSEEKSSEDSIRYFDWTNRTLYDSDESSTK